VAEQHQIPPDREVTRQSSARIGGIQLRYRSQAATTTLRDDRGRPKATVFSVAYTRLDHDPQLRPITFAFNGGPGSSSAWLHLGLAGPKRVDLGSATRPVPPPYELVDNPHSLLELTDVVLIDPVSTGFSRAAQGEKARQFHGLRADVSWVAEFIRLHLTRARRWRSPKFLLGESYGTTRAAALALHLQERHGIELNGVCLISAALVLQAGRPAPGNDLPYLLTLPSYAAAGWYHDLVRDRFPDPQALAAEVEDFALGDFARLLLLGDRVGEAESRAAADRIAAFTGLDADFVRRSQLRVPPQRFFKELLRERQRVVGRLDARFLGIDADAAGERADHDPAYRVIQGPYTAAVNDYLRSELGWESDQLYEVLNPDRVRPWRYLEEGEVGYPPVAAELGRAMARNPSLKVFLAAGIYDLATPYFAAEWALDHLGIDPALRANFTRRRYPAGHMMYIDPPTLERLCLDLQAFYSGAV
jgi:carboxypeptidase C (cathepsin A)